MAKRAMDVQRFLPMKAVHHMILLLLEEEPTYGVELLDRLEKVSAGSGSTVRLNVGSLYRTIARLVDDGLIAPTEVSEPPGLGAPPKAYRVTPLGRAVVKAESLRQAKLLELAGKLSLFGKRS
jgi:DNA-binding PadR family transcriptional regulator